MSKYKNLNVDRLLRLADVALGDPATGGQLRKRAETAKVILELVALLTAIPQSQEAAPEGG